MAFGHMGPPVVAAFDPIFWLHHANVDRQMALFQAVFPTTYVEAYPAQSETYTIAAGDVLDTNTREMLQFPLSPNAEH